MDTNTTGRRNAILTVNDSSAPPTDTNVFCYVNLQACAYTAPIAVGILDASANDVIRPAVYQNSGGTRTIAGNANRSWLFWGIKVSD